jgi:hypothetical protein
VYGLDTTVTVADIEKSAQFFRDALGLKVTVDPSPQADPNRLQELGVKGGQYREAMVAWPDRTPQLNLVQFTGVEQKTLTPLVADPNATLMRMFVNDMAPVLAAVKANPDATIMDVSGGPALQNNTPWLVVRLPGGRTYLPDRRAGERTRRIDMSVGDGMSDTDRSAIKGRLALLFVGLALVSAPRLIWQQKAAQQEIRRGRRRKERI